MHEIGDDFRHQSILLGFTQSIYKQILLKRGIATVIDRTMLLTVQPNLRAPCAESSVKLDNGRGNLAPTITHISRKWQHPLSNRVLEVFHSVLPVYVIKSEQAKIYSVKFLYVFIVYT